MTKHDIEIFRYYQKYVGEKPFVELLRKNTGEVQRFDQISLKIDGCVQLKYYCSCGIQYAENLEIPKTAKEELYDILHSKDVKWDDRVHYASAWMVKYSDQIEKMELR